MGFCPTDCTPATILANPSGLCVTDFRRTLPSRIFFYACQTTLPNPVTNANMLAMYNAGTLVVSVELVNMVFEAPAIEALQISDCRPPKEVVSTRTITFEDRTGIIDNTNSPTYNLYADYDFWFNKISNSETLNFMIGYCNGDVKIPVDSNGLPMYATLSGYLDYIKAQAGGGASTETKKMKLVFQGDPLALNIKPAFNFINAGFNI